MLQVTRATCALLTALALALALPGPAQAARGNQGLQGGWAVDDRGGTGFLHSSSLQFPLMKKAGAGWVRINFRLGSCFGDWVRVGCNGKTALATYDEVLGAARKNKLKVLGLVSNESWHGNQLDWTANNAETVAGGNGDNAYIRAFAADAAGVLAEHFRGRVDAWEVWNEPNAWTVRDANGNPAGGSFVYPSNFAWLLRRSYEVIAAQSGATVVSGGLFGHDIGGETVTIVERGRARQVTKHGELVGPARPAGRAAAACAASIPSGADYLCATYVQGISQAGWRDGAYPLDQVGQHLYVDQGSATSSAKLSTYLEDVRGAVQTYEGAGTAKKTVITEIGWSTASVSARTQAANLKTAYGTFRKRSYVGRAFWFNVQDIPEAALYYGLVDGGGGAKRALKQYQRSARY